MCECVYLCVYVLFIYVRMCTLCARVCICMHMYLCVKVYLYANVCIYVCIYMCVYVYMYIYECICVWCMVVYLCVDVFIHFAIKLAERHISIQQKAIFCFFRFSILDTTKVLSGRVPNCDSTHLCQLNSTAPLRLQANIELTSPCPILVVPTIRLGSDKYQFCKSSLSLCLELNPRLPARESSTLPIKPLRYLTFDVTSQLD